MEYSRWIHQLILKIESGSHQNVCGYVGDVMSLYIFTLSDGDWITIFGGRKRSWK